NVEQATRLVADLKRVRPEVVVVLGGPEVSYETEEQEIVRLADYVIAGEGDGGGWERGGGGWGVGGVVGEGGGGGRAGGEGGEGDSGGVAGVWEGGEV